MISLPGWFHQKTIGRLGGPFPEKKTNCSTGIIRTKLEKEDSHTSSKLLLCATALRSKCFSQNSLSLLPRKHSFSFDKSDAKSSSQNPSRAMDHGQRTRARVRFRFSTEPLFPRRSAVPIHICIEIVEIVPNCPSNVEHTAFLVDGLFLLLCLNRMNRA